MAHVIKHEGLCELMSDLYRTINSIKEGSGFNRNEIITFDIDRFHSEFSDAHLNFVATLAARYIEGRITNSRVIMCDFVDTFIYIDFKTKHYDGALIIGFLSDRIKPCARKE